VVGIGASAGGLEALIELLEHLPERTGMAFVLVQHLDPRHESLLSEVLSRKTRLPVTQAVEGREVEPDRMYVIPPNKNMTLEKGTLRLTTRTLYRGQHMPVDIFLRSLAADRKSRAVGIILSGGNTDGALGVEAIKAEGGITMAQEPNSARHPDMPSAAIATGCTDFVLSPSKIANELVRIDAHPYIRTEAEEKTDDDVEEVELQVDAAEVRPSSDRRSKQVYPADTQSLQRVMMILRNTIGVDFSQYKPATLRRADSTAHGAPEDR
jgi:two-component system, chemotaxis family, CheB/CheR fusion protein